MRIIAFACLTAAVVFAGAFSADAAPKPAASKACDFDACVNSCAKSGGRARLCPQFCQKKFRENPKCK